MRLSTILLSIIVFGALITGFYSFINDMAGATAFDVDVDTRYQDAFDKSNNVSLEMQSHYNSISNWSAKKGSAYSIITLIPDAMSLVIDMIKLPFLLTADMLTTLGTFVGLPAWFMLFLGTVILIILIFAVVNFIKGGES